MPEHDRVDVAGPLKSLNLTGAFGFDEATVEELRDDGCHSFDDQLRLIQVRNDVEQGEVGA